MMTIWIIALFVFLPVAALAFMMGMNLGERQAARRMEREEQALERLDKYL